MYINFMHVLMYVYWGPSSGLKRRGSGPVVEEDYRGKKLNRHFRKSNENPSLPPLGKRGRDEVTKFALRIVHWRVFRSPSSEFYLEKPLW